jgi:hypothetical protein
VECESPVGPAAFFEQYSGAVAWAVERDGMHSRLNLVAAAFTRNRRGPFQAHLALYTEAHPEGRAWASPRTQFDHDLHIELGEAFGPGSFEGYVEVVVTSPNQDLRPQHYNEVWLDYYADDGRMHVVLPTVQFYGSVKRTLGGENQVWPGLIATETFIPSLIAINPYREGVDLEVTALRPDGARAAPVSLTIPPRGQRRLRLPDVLGGLAEFLRPAAGLGTLLVASSHKVICYFMVENAVTGTVTGMDHLAWFYGERV